MSQVIETKRLMELNKAILQDPEINSLNEILKKKYKRLKNGCKLITESNCG